MSDENKRDIFGMDKQNPRPFKQPFLVIRFEGLEEWYIDIGGEIDLYLHRYTAFRESFETLTDKEREAKGIPWIGAVFGEVSDWTSQATPLLQTMLARLKEVGWTACQVWDYVGSAGPSHVLLNGAIFKRVNVGALAELRKDILQKRKEKSLEHHNPDVAPHVLALLGE